VLKVFFFRLQFLNDHANIILLGTVGLGKTHLATAIGYTACLVGKSVLFATAVDAINTLAAVSSTTRASRFSATNIKVFSAILLSRKGFAQCHI
jgi:DNA replication protein DnaC